MPIFKPVNAPTGGNFAPDTSKFLKPRVAYIPNRLSGSDKITRLRILPAVTQTAAGAIEEEVALNPEAGAGDPTPASALFGPVFMVSEMALELGFSHSIFLTQQPGGQNITRSGEVSSLRWSPYNVFRYNFFWKLREIQMRLAAGQQPDVPKAWLTLVQKVKDIGSILPNASSYLIAQVLAYTVDGQECKQDGQPRPQYGVHILKRSAYDAFLAAVGTRENPDEKLTLDNNQFGDFCSIANGHLVLMRRIETAEINPKKVRKPNQKRVSYQFTLRQPVPMSPEQAKLYWRPWDTILQYPAIEDVIDWMIKAIGPEAVDYGLRDSDYAKYLPSDVAGLTNEIPKAPPTQKLALELGQGPATATEEAGDADDAVGGADDLPSITVPPPLTVGTRVDAPAPAPEAPKSSTRYWAHAEGYDAPKDVDDQGAQALVDAGTPGLRLTLKGQPFDAWHLPEKFNFKPRKTRLDLPPPVEEPDAAVPEVSTIPPAPALDAATHEARLQRAHNVTPAGPVTAPTVAVEDETAFNAALSAVRKRKD